MNSVRIVLYFFKVILPEKEQNYEEDAEEKEGDDIWKWTP